MHSWSGVVFWFNAAMIVRLSGARVFSAGNPYLGVFFALTVQLTLFSMHLIALVSGRNYRQLLEPVVVITLTATLLAGVALAWFRPLYSQSFEVALHGAAWIRWGAG